MTASGERAIEAVRAAWGGLDAAVATAGISMSVTGDARVDRLDLATWELILRTNLTGTRMNAHVLADPALMAEAEALIPMHRVGQPAEVAGIIEWLTSDDASYATGGYFTIDGGQTCL